jgi:hypothetical protein
MNYHGTYATETIYVTTGNEVHYIELTKSGDDPIFFVTTCCNEDWVWAFNMDMSNYDMVKHVIMDVIFDSEDMEELIDTLDEVFEEVFADILVDGECDCGCNHCGCM